jgi:hypothetical protein
LKEKREKEEEQERKAKEMREEAERKQKEDAVKAAAQAEEEKKKAEEQQKKDEEERKIKAEQEAAIAAKASAIGIAPAGAEGSPQAEFERWTAKMTVRPSWFLLPTAPCSPTSFTTAHQVRRSSRCLAKPRLAQSLLYRQAVHHSQNRSTYLFRLRYPPHHHPTRRASLLTQTFPR